MLFQNKVSRLIAQGYSEAALSGSIRFESHNADRKQKAQRCGGEETLPQQGVWNLILVNPWNSLPADYTLSLTELKNGLSVDSRCYPDLQAMMDACRADGLSPVICSAYRTQEYQEKLFQNKVDRLIAQGYSDGAARSHWRYRPRLLLIIGYRLRHQQREVRLGLG